MLPALPMGSGYDTPTKKLKSLAQPKSRQRLSKTVKFGKLNPGLSAKNHALDIQQAVKNRTNPPGTQLLGRGLNQFNNANAQMFKGLQTSGSKNNKKFANRTLDSQVPTPGAKKDLDEISDKSHIKELLVNIDSTLQTAKFPSTRDIETIDAQIQQFTEYQDSAALQQRDAVKESGEIYLRFLRYKN